MQQPVTIREFSLSSMWVFIISVPQLSVKIQDAIIDDQQCRKCNDVKPFRESDFFKCKQPIMAEQNKRSTGFQDILVEFVLQQQAEYPGIALHIL